MTNNSDSPRTTVILPAYNAAGFLERAVRSVMAQTDPDFELVIVDDHSTDGTLDLARRLEEEFENLTVIALPSNAGVSAARNAGLDAARGSWISFIDSDDQYLPAFLETMHAATAPDVDLVVGGRIVVQPDGTETRNGSRALGEFDGAEACRLAMCDQLTPFPWDKLYRRELFSKVRFAEGAARFEDMAVNVILHSLSRRVRSIDTPVYRYYIMDASLTWGRVPTVADTTVAMNHLNEHLDQRFKEGKYGAAYDCMRSLVILLVAQSAIARGTGSPAAAATVAECRKDLSWRMLYRTLAVHIIIGAGAVLLKLTPSLYAYLYLRHIRAAYGMGKPQTASSEMPAAGPPATPASGSGID
ncbi:glycosyltransferase family 2 protein [Pseudarthrobacter sp. H3Y2-7]|uniref:glycosyltransferase family 2 protein n=1 Tax=Pseudarthrobacter naphthalenicus TaxID=3031328 RepID=UPI0023B031DD|nr:glycosyltransferase family 2 protein [Pseudarthrobacter sp. H3Y2-7]MDE8667364.1 glycosyltransferase family 2 protein [Pseudarthrobacter sp. H3Y2-7]